MRQPLAGGERGAALEVDEDEGQLGRGRTHREPGDERAQELRLAGAGGAADEPVGAVAHQVDVEGAGLPHAHRGADARGRVPQAQHALDVRLVDAEDRVEPHQARQAGARHPQFGVLEAGEVGGASHRRVEVDARQHDVADLPALAGHLYCRGGVLGDGDDHGAGGGQLLLGGRDDDSGDRGHRGSLTGAARAAAMAQQGAGRGVAALQQHLGVEHQQHAGAGQAVDGVLQPAQHALAAGLVCRQPLGAVLAAPLADVGQPGREVPVISTRRIAEHADGEVGRTAVHGRLADQAARERERSLALADDADDACVDEVDLHGRSPDARTPHDLADLLVELLGAAGVQRRLPRHVTDTGVQRQEVVA